jgi:hypothetical protein
MIANWKMPDLIHLLHYMKHIRNYSIRLHKYCLISCSRSSPFLKNLVRDIRASGTTSETTEGTNKPCQIISQVVQHFAEAACRKKRINTQNS